ncbi:Ig-like domain-containing protein [Ferrimonas futtsuensis]|uniref:Ig-like domain-containing protein n=1 Tax=Ferrimonas futtsuensis TaxID=364764 RepID=UPI0006887720|nr:Ig-like domain-containing protein [Ferrimonas futtsuensis]
MKTHTKLLASLIAATLLTACGSDDNNNDTVLPDPNTPPVAVDLDATTTSATAIMIDALASASDADGDTLTLSSAVATHGNAEVKDGQIQYDPAGYVGDDVIDYKVSDGTDETAAKILVTVTKEVIELTYVGSETCGGCHSGKFESHQKHGHNFKISKIDGEMPTFPYTDVTGALETVQDGATPRNTLGVPESYQDVTYTTGGYWKKIRFFDKNGHIVTGADVQYNLYGSGDQQLSDYKNAEKYDDLVYKCGNCHNTGWKPFDETLNPHRQDDLAGMGGTFALAAVQCEACHGAGSEHVKAPSAENITKIAKPRSSELLQSDTMGFGAPVHCGECHTRDGDRNHGNGYVNKFHTAFPDSDLPETAGRIDASGGLTKHHQTYDEFLGIDPETGEATNPHYLAGLDCVSCHDPHKSTVNKGDSGAKLSVCSDCHANKAFNDGAVSLHANFACTSCHMPEVVKNATTTVTNGGVTFGDEMTHVVTIDLFNEKPQITEDNKMNPFLKDAWACGECHAEGSKLQSLKDNFGGKIHK